MEGFSELGGQIKEGHLSFWGERALGGVYARSLNLKPFSGAGVEEWADGGQGSCRGTRRRGGYRGCMYCVRRSQCL